MKIIKFITCFAAVAAMFISCGSSPITENADARKVADFMGYLENENMEMVEKNIDATIEVLANYKDAEEEQIVSFYKEVSKLILKDKGISKEEIQTELENVTDEEYLKNFKELCIAISLIKTLK